MTLTPGTRLGSFEITGSLGAGGMGEVYRGRDTRLKREVALKLLPESFAADPDRLARFQREAEVLASLNHPHIAAIHGIEEANGTRALVLELVDGETLADRIARGPIRLEEALPIAWQIADALEAAHEQGIIHRDLKPANIKVRPDGTVKVLDFGLAKALEPADAMDLVGRGFSPAGPAGFEDTAYTHSPTITSPAAMTGVGVLLGTAAYMSPEQAKGRPADRRSDVWAFGAVLYEMLTGHRAFKGEDVSDTMASVLKADIDWKAFPAEVPQTVVGVIRRCLTRDRNHRLRDVGDVALALEDGLDPAGWQHLQASRPAPRREYVAWGLVAVLTATVAGIVIFGGPPLPVDANAPLRRLSIVPPPDVPGAFDQDFRLSPDGSMLAFAAPLDGALRLWVRPLDSLTARVLPGTENYNGGLAWFPDSRSIVYVSGRRLVRLDVAGRAPQTIVEDVGGLGSVGASVNSEGDILFATTNLNVIYHTTLAGDEVSAVTSLDQGRGEIGHTVPRFLPDGDHFVYFARGPESGINLGSLSTGESRRLARSDSKTELAAGRTEQVVHLVFVRDNTLLTQRFDAAALELMGQPQSVSDATVRASRTTGRAPFAVSNGLLAYREGVAENELVWRHRDGDLAGRVDAPPGLYTHVELSPDASTVAVGRMSDRASPEGWLLAVEGGAARLDSDEALWNPMWSPDGLTLALSEADPVGSEGWDIVIRPADGSGLVDTMFSSDDQIFLSDWSPDGAFVVFRRIPIGGTGSLWALPMSGGAEPWMIRGTEAQGRNGRVSPDGEWLAFVSLESGRPQVWVHRFPEPGNRFRVSTDGGVLPRWRQDGRELYFVRPVGQGGGGELMVVTFQERTTTIGFSTPEPLFPLTFFSDSFNDYPYAVSPDGDRFLVLDTSGASFEEALTVVLNWQDSVEP